MAKANVFTEEEWYAATLRSPEDRLADKLKESKKELEKEIKDLRKDLEDLRRDLDKLTKFLERVK